MVDKKDVLILESLKKNAKASVLAISKETGLPGTTVHNRIKKLRKNGVIKGYTIKVDNRRIGKKTAAYILLTVDYKLLKGRKISQAGLARQIIKDPSVEEANMVTGNFDIIVKVRVEDIDELNNTVTEKLRNIDGVEKTQTMVILKETIL